LQLALEKEMLWIFWCGMEPTSMKKRQGYPPLDKQMTARDVFTHSMNMDWERKRISILMDE
jgi:hypothetical protein